MERTFYYGRKVRSYDSHLKESVERYEDLAPLLDKQSNGPRKAQNIRVAINRHDVKLLSPGVLSGGGFDELPDDDGKKVEKTEKGNEKDDEKS